VADQPDPPETNDVAALRHEAAQRRQELRVTTGFPLRPLTASTFIRLGMSGVDLGGHQRFIFKWAFGSTLVMTAVATATGALI
jgi:hypothetical protein